SSTTGRDYATVAYNAATGATNWTRRYTGYANGNDLPYAVRVSPDGTRVFVTGSAAGPPSTNYDYATLAYDASSGTILWTTRYNGPGADTAYSLAVSPDGTRVFVTGQSLEYPTGDDYLTIAYDALTGVALGGARYNGPGNGTDDAFSVAVSPDGTRLFVTGQSAGSGTGFDYATIAYSV
ncbi:MAG TPA: PQQ-binding-like beta-propeller repeat protein, partial [Actinomycetota bacterium]